MVVRRWRVHAVAMVLPVHATFLAIGSTAIAAIATELVLVGSRERTSSVVRVTVRKAAPVATVLLLSLLRCCGGLLLSAEKRVGGVVPRSLSVIVATL